MGRDTPLSRDGLSRRTAELVGGRKANKGPLGVLELGPAAIFAAYDGGELVSALGAADEVAAGTRTLSLLG